VCVGSGGMVALCVTAYTNQSSYSPQSLSQLSIPQVAELQLMKEQAEEAGVGVLMGYNKVS
jgi:hypothetical protein